MASFFTPRPKTIVMLGRTLAKTSHHITQLLLTLQASTGKAEYEILVDNQSILRQIAISLIISH